MDFILDINNLTISYDDKVIFDDISFGVKDASIIPILGANNSGKTTFLKTIAGINKSFNGNISVENIKSSQDKKYFPKVSYIGEDIDKNFIMDTVKEEIAFPLIHLAYSKSKITKKMDSVSLFCEVDEFMNEKIFDLSNYDKVRVAIATAIVADPKILLLDDVFRYLKDNEKRELINLIKKIREEYGITIIFTTSDIKDVYNLKNIFVIGDKRIVMVMDYDKLILEDNLLSKLGINIPIMLDLSRKLEFYKLIDKEYYDRDKLVDALWK